MCFTSSRSGWMSRYCATSSSGNSLKYLGMGLLSLALPPPWRFHPITSPDRSPAAEARATTRLYVVPVWLRVLAGLLALAALFASLSLVGTGMRGIADLQTLLLTAAQIILDVCMGGLFAYVAVTGLAPTHLMRSAGDSWTGGAPRFRLEPELQRYLQGLQAQQPQITECWILGRGLKGRADQFPAQWWLLAFGPATLAETLQADWNIRRRDVRLFVVDSDTDSVHAAWGRPYTGALADWHWRFIADEVAHFNPPADAGEYAQTGDRADHDAESMQLAERLWGRE